MNTYTNKMNTTNWFTNMDKININSAFFDELMTHQKDLSTMS